MGGGGGGGGGGGAGESHLYEFTGYMKPRRLHEMFSY